jgi:hypothetical protein
MSTLPDNAPFFAKFKNGDHGWSHAAQEFGVYAVASSLAGWLISPAIAAVIIGLLAGGAIKFKWVGDDFWLQREVDQSMAMIKKGANRTHTPDDLIRVPDEPNSFWTPDGSDDVLFPRKMRKFIIIAGFVYCVLQFSIVGFLGLLF